MKATTNLRANVLEPGEPAPRRAVITVTVELEPGDVPPDGNLAELEREILSDLTTRDWHITGTDLVFEA